MQQHHQLIGGMIGNNQQPQPGSQSSYSNQYKHQIGSSSQMLGLNSNSGSGKQQSLSQQRRANPNGSASQPANMMVTTGQSSSSQNARVVVYEKLKKKMQGGTRV